MPRPKSHELQKALGQAIRLLRERHEHLTPQKVAKRAGIQLRTLENIEAGEVDTTWNTTFWIAEALGVSMKELTELEEAIRRDEEGAARATEGRDGEGDGNDDASSSAGSDDS